MVQDYSHQPLTAEDQIHCQLIILVCRICSGQSDTGCVFFSKQFGFPVLMFPSMLRIHSLITHVIYTYHVTPSLNKVPYKMAVSCNQTINNFTAERKNLTNS